MSCPDSQACFRREAETFPLFCRNRGPARLLIIFSIVTAPGLRRQLIIWPFLLINTPPPMYFYFWPPSPQRQIPHTHFFPFASVGTFWLGAQPDSFKETFGVRASPLLSAQIAGVPTRTSWSTAKQYFSFITNDPRCVAEQGRFWFIPRIPNVKKAEWPTNITRAFYKKIRSDPYPFKYGAYALKTYSLFRPERMCLKKRQFLLKSSQPAAFCFDPLRRHRQPVVTERKHRRQNI